MSCEASGHSRGQNHKLGRHKRGQVHGWVSRPVQMQLVGQSAAPDWECTWGRPLKMKFREDGMELWLPMVISINLANSFLAQAGRPQTPERHWLTFRFLNSYPFLPPSWNAVPFVQMFFLILLSNTTEQLVTSVTAQLSFLGHFSEDSSGFPEYWIHWYGIDSNLMISPFCGCYYCSMPKCTKLTHFSLLCCLFS